MMCSRKHKLRIRHKNRTLERKTYSHSFYLFLASIGYSFFAESFVSFSLFDFTANNIMHLFYQNQADLTIKRIRDSLKRLWRFGKQQCFWKMIAFSIWKNVRKLSSQKEINSRSFEIGYLDYIKVMLSFSILDLLNLCFVGTVSGKDEFCQCCFLKKILTPRLDFNLKINFITI